MFAPIMRTMFTLWNQRKLMLIVLSFVAFISVLITLILINDKKFGLYHNYLNYYPTKVRPKIFCMITTRMENHMTKAIHVKNTWAKKCDNFLFFSSTNHTTLPSISLCKNDDRNHLWCKTRKGFHYIYDNYINQFDWFLKADDDTYIIVNNLRSFLSSHSPNNPIYFGCKFKRDGVVYMSGGAGYVLSREALRRFAIKSRSNTTGCKTNDDGPEDYELGRCLQNFGVIAGDSRDKSLKPRFFMLEPWKIAWEEDSLSAIAPWFNNYSVYHHKSGPDCCSPTLISFHYVSYEIMYLIEFLLNDVKVQ